MCFKEWFNHEDGIPRLKNGKRQTLETLIPEEALLLAKYLRNESREWLPRIWIEILRESVVHNEIG